MTAVRRCSSSGRATGPRAAPRAVRDAALFRFWLLHGRVEVVDAQLRGLAADVDLGPLLVGGQRGVLSEPEPRATSGAGGGGAWRD